MSHELRTPLNAIIGFSEMIDSGYFGPLNNKKQQERIHDINLCGTHLLQLINDILDYSKGEAGKLELHDAEIGIHRIIDESERMVKEKAKNKEIEIINNVSADFPRIMADERKIKQILINLLSNAIKFTNKGGEINVHAEKLDNGEVRISVKDNGVGISEEDIPKALSVFGQIKSVRIEPEEEGTGLGLPLCKMLTELHGGEFEITSEVGVGTTVSIILPKERVVVKE
jgi:signal transduction histidine kinase